jgi:hypothetical protein
MVDRLAKHGLDRVLRAKRLKRSKKWLYTVRYGEQEDPKHTVFIRDGLTSTTRFRHCGRELYGPIASQSK